MDEPTNWCDLPAEMMAEVIKHLDFASRMKLRATARLEKELVESNKMAVERVSVDSSFRDGPFVFVECHHEPSGLLAVQKYEGFNGSTSKLISLTTSLIKFCKVTIFNICSDKNSRHFLDNAVTFLEKIVEGGNFRFPILSVNHLNNDDFQSLLELCAPGTDLISFYRPPDRGFKRVFRDPATLPLLLGASVIELHLDDHSLSDVVVEAWIRNHQPIGKKLIIWLGAYNDEDKWQYEREQLLEEELVSNFKSCYLESVVMENEKSVRIRMDDSSKHILMRILEEEDVEPRGFSKLQSLKKTRVVAIWQMIPSDLAEEQYEKSSGYVYFEL